VELVRSSERIVHFEVAYIPGVLQTADYARRVLAESARLHRTEVDDLDVAVAERMRRQQFLYEPGRQFEFLMTEAVLRFVLPEDPAVMRAQLDRLQSVIGMSNVRFGVVPFGASLPVTPQHSFQIYGATLAIEGFAGADYFRGAQVEHIERVLALLWSEAVEGEAARPIINAAQAALPPAQRQPTPSPAHQTERPT
jgi:hypothetical protein